MREKLIEQKKKRIKKVFLIIIIVFLLGVIVFARILLPNFLKTFSLFSLKNIVIEPNEYASLIKGYISLPEGTSLLTVDMSGIYSKIKQIYFIEDCFIEKHFPDTLFIKLKIRTPWVVVVDSTTALLMDRNGYFLPLQENFKGWAVDGIKLKKAGEKTDEEERVLVLKEIEQWYNYYGIHSLFAIDSISLIDLDKIVLKASDEVMFIHREDIEKQMAIAKEVLKSCRKNSVNFEYLDLRFKEPYIKEKEKDQQ